METLFYEMMETGVGPAKFIGFLFLMIFAGIKLFFMIAVISACFKYIHKDD
jgi:hypothetical protein